MSTQSNLVVKHVKTEHEWRPQEQNKQIIKSEQKALFLLKKKYTLLHLHFIMHREKLSVPTPENHHFHISWGRTSYKRR